jgi:hypothetical protein
MDIQDKNIRIQDKIKGIQDKNIRIQDKIKGIQDKFRHEKDKKICVFDNKK